MGVEDLNHPIIKKVLLTYHHYAHFAFGKVYNTLILETRNIKAYRFLTKLYTSYFWFVFGAYKTQ